MWKRFEIFLLDAFLGMRSEYYIYGLTVVGGLLKSSATSATVDWPLSERFPRVTLCDFQVRQLANVQPYTVQCVLPINLFNEKIFLLIWFWLIFVAVATFVSLLHWTSKLSIMSIQVSIAYSLVTTKRVVGLLAAERESVARSQKSLDVYKF